MLNQKGIAHLLLLLVLVVASGVGIYLLIQFGIIKNPFGKLPFIGEKTVNITTKSEYKNPFKKETQYVNPFNTYKNPFVVSR